MSTDLPPKRTSPTYAEYGDDLVIELDQAVCIALVNAEAAHFLGVSRAALIGLPAFEWLAQPDEQADACQACENYLRARSVTPMDLETTPQREGEAVRVVWQITPRRGIKGQYMGLRLVGAPLNAAQGTALLMREAWRRLHDLRYAIDQASILAISDSRDRILQVNDTFTAISGYTREELLGRTHRIINSGHHPPSFFRHMWGTIREGNVWRADICNRAKDGHLYWVNTTIVPLVDNEGRPHKYLALRTEITEHKQMEADLARTVAALEERNHELAEANRRILEERTRMVQAEKLSSVGLLAAGVAHEINNPLAGVMACVSALREGRVNPQRRETYFQTVADGLERMQGIVRALLNYARPAQPSRTAVSLDEIVEACLLLVRPHANRHRLRFSHEVPEEPPRVVGDRSQLMQAAMNVLLNALHASPEGGCVCLRYRIDEARGRTALVVIDEGGGIPADLIDRVTDPFFSTKPEGQGTGLGLSVTQGIVQAHGGELILNSPPGRPAQPGSGGGAPPASGRDPARESRQPSSGAQGPGVGTEAIVWLKTWRDEPGEGRPA